MPSHCRALLYETGIAAGFFGSVEALAMSRSLNGIVFGANVPTPSNLKLTVPSSSGSVRQKSNGPLDGPANSLAVPRKSTTSPLKSRRSGGENDGPKIVDPE